MTCILDQLACLGSGVNEESRLVACVDRLDQRLHSHGFKLGRNMFHVADQRCICLIRPEAIGKRANADVHTDASQGLRVFHALRYTLLVEIGPVLSQRYIAKAGIRVIHRHIDDDMLQVVALETLHDLLSRDGVRALQFHAFEARLRGSIISIEHVVLVEHELEVGFKSRHGYAGICAMATSTSTIETTNARITAAVTICDSLITLAGTFASQRWHVVRGDLNGQPRKDTLPAARMRLPGTHF